MKLCLCINGNENKRDCNVNLFNYLVIDYYDLDKNETGVEKVTKDNISDYICASGSTITVFNYRHYLVSSCLDYDGIIHTKESDLQGSEFRFFDVNGVFRGSSDYIDVPNKYYLKVNTLNDATPDFRLLMLHLANLIDTKNYNYFKVDGDYLLVKTNPYIVRLRILDNGLLNKLLLFR